MMATGSEARHDTLGSAAILGKNLEKLLTLSLG
jgi:hypothetical protein